ncbi:hypothetical protein LTSEMIS_0127 [Salmonella enterica subsp. enterica serovar Mississippi str. A4-633]|nr:hypothetical protein LTSEMIS_0127 [Salmonella enterica subsp. enterica serovar Mississippi str. A4-633]
MFQIKFLHFLLIKTNKKYRFSVKTNKKYRLKSIAFLLIREISNKFEQALF